MAWRLASSFIAKRLFMMHMMIFLLASIPFALSLAIFALVIARRGNWRRFDAAAHSQAKPAGFVGQPVFQV